jgi:hypothetical protein
VADCRTLKHWRPLWSLVLLLFANPSFSAPNLCASVFHAEASMAALNNVAQMKFDLDIIQSRGSSLITGSQRKLQNEFPKKYAELVKGLEGRFSEPQVRRMVMTRIQEFQKIKDLENEKAIKEAKKKPKVNKIIQAAQFVLKERIEIPHKIFNEKTTMKYAREAGALFGHNEDGELIRFDIATRKAEIFLSHTTVAFDLLANGKELVALTQDGFLTTYDVKTLKITSQKTISPIDWALKYLHLRGATVDPTGSTMALDSAGDGLKVIDLKTGAVKTFNSTNTKLLNFADKFQLVSKDQIVVRSTGAGSNGEVSMLDVRTGDVTVIEKVGTYGDILLLDGGKKLMNKESVIADIDAGLIKYYTRPTDYLTQAPQITQRTIFNKEYFLKLSPLAKGDYVFMEVHMSEESTKAQEEALSHYEIYHISNLNVPVFAFQVKDRDTEADVLKHIAFSKNNKGAVLYFDSNMAMFPSHIEVWEQGTELSF